MDITNAQTSNIFSFATEQAKTIVQLHYIDLAMCFIILAIVAGLMTAIVLKFRHRGETDYPEQTHGNLKYEIGWTLVPTLTLIVMGILTAVVMHSVNPPIGKTQPDVIVVGHQWWWEYRYPKYGVVTANELYLPVGKNSLLELRAADVIHSFWVPNFGEKMDCIPGHTNNLFLQPTQVGVFTGSCSEYCGAQHGLMRILVNVVPQKDFETWIDTQKKVPAAPTEAHQVNGEKLLLAKTCMECHNVAGTAAVARVAPDLTHIATRRTLGSGVIANNMDNLTNWIMNPQTIKPGCMMPEMRLAKSDAHDIAAYLENLK
jgi:cytochrome c oxidase subunit 2